MSDHGYLLIQAIFQTLQLYSWGFALIELFQTFQHGSMRITHVYVYSLPHHIHQELNHSKLVYMYQYNLLNIAYGNYKLI